MCVAQLFDKRPPLFELAQRGCMKPHVLRSFFNFVAQYVESIAFASPHLPHLGAEKTGNGNAQKIDVNDDVIHECKVFDG